MSIVDEKDKKLLNLLNSSPGLTQAQLAEKLGVTKLTINNRIKRLKEKKILLYTEPVIDLKKLGYIITVLVNAKIKNGKLVEAAQKYAQDPSVCNAYTITGDYDMVLTAKFHDTKELENWNIKMSQDTEYIERINTSLVFTTQKEKTNPNKIE